MTYAPESLLDTGSMPPKRKKSTQKYVPHDKNEASRHESICSVSTRFNNAHVSTRELRPGCSPMVPLHPYKGWLHVLYIFLGQADSIQCQP